MKSKYPILVSFLLLLTLVSSTSYIHAQVSEESVTKESAERLLKSADKLRKYKDYNGAIRDYNKVLALDPENIKAEYNKALCFYETGDTISTLVTLEKVIKKDPNFVGSYALATRTLKKMKRYEQAAVYAAKTSQLETDPAKKKKYKMMSLQFYAKEGYYEKVIKSGQEYLSLDPGNLDATYLIAHSQNGLGKYAEAIILLSPVAEKMTSSNDKMSDKIYYELGSAYFNEKKYEEAQPIFRKITGGKYKKQILQYTPEYHYKLARAFSGVLLYERASESLESAIKIKPNYFEAHKLQGEIDEKLGDNNEMLKVYKEGASGASDKLGKVEMLKNVVELEYNSKRYSDAVSSATECIAIKDIRSITFIKAMALYRNNEIEDAVQLLEGLLKITEINPDEYAKYSFALGLIYVSQEDSSNAVKAFKLAKRGLYRTAATHEIDTLNKPKAKQSSN